MNLNEENLFPRQEVILEKFSIRAAVSATSKEFYLGPIATRLKLVADEAVKKADEDKAAADKATAEAKAAQTKADAAKAAADKASADLKIATSAADKARADAQALKAVADKSNAEASAAQTSAAQAVTLAKAKQLAAQAAAQLAASAQKKLAALKFKISQGSAGLTQTKSTNSAQVSSGKETSEPKATRNDQKSAHPINQGSSGNLLLGFLVLLGLIAIFTFVLKLWRKGSAQQNSVDSLTNELSSLETWMKPVGTITLSQDKIRKAPPSKSAAVKRQPRVAATKAAVKSAAPKKATTVRKAAPKKSTVKKAAPKKR